MEPIDITLEDGEADAQEAEPEEFPDIPDRVCEFRSLPDHRQAAARKAFLTDILQGIKPDHAAAARGIDKWSDDKILAQLVNMAEKQCVARVERAVYDRVLRGVAIAAPQWYWLEARGGYDRKTLDDNLPQNINLNRRVVKGE